MLAAREPIEQVKYLLTFRPFGSLPPAVRKAYLGGSLHLLPFPGSLIFWGCLPYLKLQRELPLAMQIPLLNVCDRHEGAARRCGFRSPAGCTSRIPACPSPICTKASCETPTAAPAAGPASRGTKTNCR